jgi:hypothetical protein
VVGFGAGSAGRVSPSAKILGDARIQRRFSGEKFGPKGAGARGRVHPKSALHDATRKEGHTASPADIGLDGHVAVDMPNHAGQPAVRTCQHVSTSSRRQRASVRKGRAAIGLDVSADGMRRVQKGPNRREALGFRGLRWPR